MTSPTPDAATAPDSKRASPETEKVDVNGHGSNEPKSCTPKAESSPASDSEKPKATAREPLVNGKSSDNAAANGRTSNGDAAQTESRDDDNQKNDGDASLSSKAEDNSTEPAREKHAEKPVEEEQEERDDESDDEKASKPEAPQSEDVQMTDATNANDISRDDRSSKPSPESKSPAKSDADDATTAKAEVEAKVEDTEETKSPKELESENIEKLEKLVKTSKTDEAAIPTPPTAEADTSRAPTEAPADVVMSDAPSSVAKVSREREEDFGGEPLAKRAKTEPKEEEEPAAAVAAPASAGGTPSAASAADGANRLTTLTKWEDAETDNKPITMHQRREIRKILARAKKTKNGGHFRDSVPKLWPQLGDSYLARIDKPMDLSEIDRKIRDPNGAYGTFGDFRKDLSLIYENTMAFNGASHEITGSAFYAIRSVWQETVLIPEEEPTRPKSVAKPKPLRDPRSLSGTDALVRRQSSGPVSSPPREVSEPKPRPPPPQQQQQQQQHQESQQGPGENRRGSTADADRPKRTVRAPKPKDIDYSSKPSRKKLKPELQFCDEVLLELMHPKHQVLNTWFMDAVDAEGLNIPDYYSIIKKPMDLGKVSRLLNSGEISSLKEFDRSLRLIFGNCYQFNGPPEQGNPVSLTAKQLEDLYSQQMKGKDAWLARYAKANAPAAASHGSDEEEEEEESDEGEEANVPRVDYSKEVREYSTKLDEESKKLHAMFASGALQGMVDCQKQIVEALQKALYQAAQSLNEAKPKQEKGHKKASKSSKSKASGGGGHAAHRKSLSSLPTGKKPGSSKKAAPKRTLTAADKDAIASAINDLETAHLDRAIDIIKRDTGQNENNEGELELDIDQLSSEALLKLWDLCKKVLPGFVKSSGRVKSPEVTKSTPSKSGPKSASKPKKNKPMSAQEQEARIAQLTAISQMYKSGQEPTELAANAASPQGESSDDSDSEEE